jgi:hypothetical protein
MMYQTCGLTISSTLKLPELPQVDDTVIVKCGRNASCASSRKDGISRRRRDGIEVVDLYWPRVGRFRVTDRNIRISRTFGARDDLVRTYAVGPALAVLLHLRQVLVLHSSSVEIDGKAVAFAGASGSGKSTIAFALRQRGYRVLSDDLLVLKRSRGGWIALSGPCIPKLWPNMARALGAGVSKFERIHSLTTKQMATPHVAAASCARPLGCIYTLVVDSSLRIEQGPSREQFWGLVQNAYCRTLANTNDAVFYFMQCTQLVREVPVRQLYRTRSPGGISDLVELIERDRKEINHHIGANS